MDNLEEIARFLKRYGFKKSDILPATIRGFVKTGVMQCNPPILVAHFASQQLYAEMMRAINRRGGWNDFLGAGLTYDHKQRRHDCTLSPAANEKLLPYFD